MQDAPPTELPKGPPEEGDPTRPKEEGVGGDPNGVLGGTGRGGIAPAPKPVEPPPPPEPPPLPVMQVAEVSTPPVPVAKSMPGYPEDARKQGIEALVVVKFVVSENGQVEEPRIVKGHPLFDDVVLASVRGWTFQPATLEGRPVRMVRMVKIPFRLKHS
jgi:protein TonB